MLVLPLFFVVLLWYLIICYKWKKNIFNYIEKIPGMTWYPIWGSSYQYMMATRQEVLPKFIGVLGKYRPFFKSWHCHTPEVHIMKPEHLQVVLRSSSHTTKGTFYKYLFPWLGEGVFTSEGAKWFLQRKLLTPTFHFKILERFLNVFTEKAVLFTKKLEAKADGKYFNIAPEVAACTLGVICETAMGVPLNVITDKPEEHVQAVYDITELVMWRYFRPYIIDPIFYRLPQGQKYTNTLERLNEFSRKVISYKKERIPNKNTETFQTSEVENNNKLTSFLDIVLDAKDNKNIVSDTDLQSLVNTFIFAGYDTTANTLSWTLFLLGNNPQIQEIAYEEIRRVLKDKPSPTTMAEVNELKYVECIVREALRLFPVLPMITRKLTEDTEINGYKLPAGTQAILHILQAHMDPEHFPEPTKFNPDRFLPENTKTRHPFAYIPFSAGPRNCIGMKFGLLELKTVLATLISKFRFTSQETFEEIKLFVEVFIRSQTGIKMKLESR